MDVSMRFDVHACPCMCVLVHACVLASVVVFIDFD